MNPLQGVKEKKDMHLEYTKRNGEIEFLRFLFSLAIIGLHGNFGIQGGYLSVEFFYILSGCFMAKKIRNNENSEKRDLIDTCNLSRRYIFRRIHAIYIYFVISTIIGYIVKLMAHNETLLGATQFIGDFLFLQNYGFPVVSGTGVLWFLCALYFGIWIIFPILYKNYEVYVSYIAPVVFLIADGFLLKKYESLLVPNSFYGPVNTGFLRAIAAMSLGTVCYMLSDYYRELAHRKRLRLLGGIFELVLLIACFLYMIIWKHEYARSDGFIVMMMAAIVVIAMSETSIFNKMLSNKAARWLGRLSTVLFMNHFYWFENIDYYVDRNYSKIIALVLSFGTSICVMFIGDYIKTNVNKVNNLNLKK